MNPLTITMLLEMNFLWDKYELPDTPAHKKELRKLIKLHLVRLSNEKDLEEMDKPLGTILIEDKGVAHVVQLCRLAFPTEHALSTEDGRIQTNPNGSAVTYWIGTDDDYICIDI